MGVGDRTEGKLANNEHQNRFVVAPWSLRHLGSRAPMAAPWALRGRSVVMGILFVQICEKIGLSGFSRPRARSFSRSQGCPRADLG